MSLLLEHLVLEALDLDVCTVSVQLEHYERTRSRTLWFFPLCVHACTYIQFLGEEGWILYSDVYIYFSREKWNIPWYASQYAAILELIFVGLCNFKEIQNVWIVSSSLIILFRDLLWPAFWLKVVWRWTIFSSCREQSDEVKILIKINVARWQFKLLYYPFSFHLEKFLKLILPYRCPFKVQISLNTLSDTNLKFFNSILHSVMLNIMLQPVSIRSSICSLQVCWS